MKQNKSPTAVAFHSKCLKLIGKHSPARFLMEHGQGCQDRKKQEKEQRRFSG